MKKLTLSLSLLGLITLSPLTALAQQYRSYEEVKHLYTTTTVGLVVALPLIILNNATGNASEEPAMYSTTSSSQIVQGLVMTTGSIAQSSAMAQAFALRHSSALCQDIALGDGEVLREVLVLLMLKPSLLDDSSTRRRIRAHREALFSGLEREEFVALLLAILGA